METNLDRLDKDFPGVLVLTPEQVGKALGWDRKKIYRVLDAEAFPFPVLRTGNLISIPKIGFAKWLDDGMTEATEPTQTPPAAVPEEPQKKKRGRPRKALSILTFQSQLHAALEKNILSEAIKTALSALKTREDDKETDGAKSALSEALEAVESIREGVDFSDCREGKKTTRKRP